LVVYKRIILPVIFKAVDVDSVEVLLDVLLHGLLRGIIGADFNHVVSAGTGHAHDKRLARAGTSSTACRGIARNIACLMLVKFCVGVKSISLIIRGTGLPANVLLNENNKVIYVG
jgi:hypothetical protein